MQFKINQELQSISLLYLKALLFLTILLISVLAIIVETHSFYITVLLLLAIWSAARLYYFMFYVIEKYIDPQYKFSGIFSFLKYLFSRRRK